MFCRGNKQTRLGSRTTTSSMMELFLKHNIRKSLPHRQNSSNLDDVGALDLPLFSFYDKMIKEDKNTEDFTY